MIMLLFLDIIETIIQVIIQCRSWPIILSLQFLQRAEQTYAAVCVPFGFILPMILLFRVVTRRCLSY